MMRVVATQQGYYNHRLIEPGQVFHIRNDGDYAREWMRPAKGETAKPVSKKPHKTEAELQAEEHERQIHYENLAGKERAKAHGNTKKKGDDVEVEEGEEIETPPPPAATFGKKAESVDEEPAAEQEEETPAPKKKDKKGKKKAEPVI